MEITTVDADDIFVCKLLYVMDCLSRAFVFLEHLTTTEIDLTVISQSKSVIVTTSNLFHTFLGKKGLNRSKPCQVLRLNLHAKFVV